jgi:glycosyltransferase involved in cell wall biosynthesis
MKIGIYTYNIPIGYSGGVQQYSTRLIRSLVQDTENDIYVFTNKELADTDYKELRKYKNYHEIIFSKKVEICRKLFYNRYTLRILLPDILNKIQKKELIIKLLKALGDIKSIIYDCNINVLHFPGPIFPIYGWKIPTVLSFHDVQHEHFPEFFSLEILKYRRYHYRRSAKESSHIVVTFDHVKDDIIKFYKIDPNKITITSIGYPQSEDRQIISNPDITLAKYRIPNKFLLYPAQTWKHKNHIFLLNVLAKYKKRYDKNIFLVCTGRKNENYKNIKKVIYANKLENNVLFTDFIPEGELNALYIKSSLIVIPTLYEAGSYPLLEAMAYQRPVICSNVTSLPGIVRDRRFVFDPRNEEELCDLIHKMLTDEKLRKENIKNSRQQLQRFRWEKVINNFINAYRKAINDFEKENIPKS